MPADEMAEGVIEAVLPQPVPDIQVVALDVGKGKVPRRGTAGSPSSGPIGFAPHRARDG